MSSYFRYLQVIRPTVKERLGDQADNKKAVSVACADAWRRLDAEAKKKWDDEAKAARDTYNQQMKAFIDSGGTRAPKKESKRRKDIKDEQVEGDAKRSKGVKKEPGEADLEQVSDEALLQEVAKRLKRNNDVAIA